MNRENGKNLEKQAELCRQLWNHALEQRIMAWKYRKISVTVHDQKKELPEFKEEFPEFKKVYNKYLSATLFRLDKAFKHFFRRIKEGKKPGFPRFKNKKSFFSLETPGSYCVKENDYTLKLPQKMEIVVREKLPETIGTVVLNKKKNDWYMTIVTEVETKEKEKVKDILAFDLGIKTLAVGYNGHKFTKYGFIKKIRYYDKLIDKLKSKRDKCKKFSKRYNSYNKAISRYHHLLVNKRTNHFHHVSKWIVTQEAENAIVVGKLSVKEMVDENKYKNRETQNRWAISQFVSMLEYKSSIYGKHFVTISERNTTKKCSSCDNLKEMKLSQRVYVCDVCNFKLDRDENSVINIYNLALKELNLSN